MLGRPEVTRERERRNRRIRTCYDAAMESSLPDERLKMAMAERGINAYNLSKMTGVGYSSIHRMLNGPSRVANTYFSTMIKFACALDVPVEYFVEPDEVLAGRMLEAGRRDDYEVYGS